MGRWSREIPVPPRRQRGKILLNSFEGFRPPNPHDWLKAHIMKKLYSVRTIILAGSLLLQLNTLCFHSRGAAGDVDLSFDPGFGVNGPVNAVVVQPDGKVIIGGKFSIVKGLVRINVARLNADGSGDPTFNPTMAYDIVSSLALQSDGKVLVGGQIFHYVCDDRGCDDFYDSIISRLNANGSLDSSFNPATGAGGSPYGVSSVVVQSDGKVLLGGGFTAVNGTNRIAIARLNANGSLDGSFNPGAVAVIVYGPNYPVALALQPDGKVLIGGAYSIVNGTNRSGIVRFNANGSLDSSFDPGAGDQSVAPFALQPDGKVLIGPYFNAVSGTNYNTIYRLNANGSRDSSFNPAAVGYGRFSSIVAQTDGKVLISGTFTTVNVTNRNCIARLNDDGSLDSSFNPGAGPNNLAVTCVAVQSDGKVLIGGSFTTVNGTNRSRIARLNAEGGLDGSFYPGLGLDSAVSSVAVQPDGKVLIGGPFTFINGTNRYGSARLNANGSLDDTFVPSSFYPDLGGAIYPDFGGPTDQDWFVVAAVAVQSDGKVTVGGTAATSNDCGDGCAPYSIFSSFVTRLNSNGSRDTSFTPFYDQFEVSPAYTETVQSVALQPDGKIVVSYGGPGGYGDPTGYGRLGLVRLNANGIRDTNFNTSIGQQYGSVVVSVAPQADGKLLIGGSFNITINGTNRWGLARLNSNGSLDNTFNPAAGGYPIALQPDGKILVGGYARLNADGSLDGSFNPVTGVNGSVRSIALQADGKVLIGGGFQTVNGVWRPYVARLYGDSFPPSLNIARSNAWAIVSWPVTGLSFQLQESTNLTLSSFWSPVAQATVTNAGKISVTVPTTVGRKFFRLKSQ
jgi:uncharacterized delta-60 repeat protein